ncbi:flagellar biosynthetic protein FliR [Variovorax sp. WS11]|uniref:flagellar biosynthetic protein FliR n=1 Tax=Variovorax sp. WS11 TaxID=1105204 RepID=UPI001EF351C6|nr:flagellar biosynthetic protein FliR [Variovorax sp. WS11]
MTSPSLPSASALLAVAAPDLAAAQIAAIALLTLRIAATFAMTPVLYAVPLPTSVRMLLALSLSLALAAGLSAPAQPWTGWHAFLSAAKTELALGATLGLGILLAFGAFAIAGQLLDVQLGFGMAQVVDPVTRRPVPILTSAFEYFAVLMSSWSMGITRSRVSVLPAVATVPVSWMRCPKAPTVQLSPLSSFSRPWLL